jgi:alanine racemase
LKRLIRAVIDSAGTPILIDSQRAPIVGRVSMDMIAVDVSRLSGVHGSTPVGCVE